MIVGVEIGGTYTDVVLVEDDGRLHCHKVGTTPEDPSEGAIRGVQQILQRAGRTAADVQELVHGSTIATNTLLQRRGARTVLVTTAGFADVVFLGRTNKDAMYELGYRKPEPLLRRQQVLEVPERVSGSGQVVQPLDTTGLLPRLDALVAAQGIEAVAVCLLNAHANPAHEQQLGALLRRQRPALSVTLSSEITPEHREYERTSTATLNAYVQPVVTRYLERFAQRCRALGVREPPLIMVSSGGVVPIAAAGRMAARMFLSGPAAAVTGGSFVGTRCGVPDLITVDVGGTSTDVCLIENGRPRTTVQGTSEAQIDGLPLNVVMTDVCSIGSGGGSIAQLDAQGRLGVGPQSAGARPGPACYGRGGRQFTLTDALLILGHLDPDAELADGLRLSLPQALAAAAPLAARLQVDEAGVAQRVLRVAVADMARAVRRVSVRRGRDPRDYALLACGGCGPLLAAALADEVGIRQVLVPAHAGIFSAFGLAVSDLRLDAAAADPGGPLAQRPAAALADQLHTLRAGSVAEFAALGVAEAGLETRYLLDMRYRGQGYELRIDVAAGEAPADLVQRFHEQHERQYGYRMHYVVEAVMQRCTLTRRRSPPSMHAPPAADAPVQPPRKVHAATGQQAWPVCLRSQLGPDTVSGPLVVMEDSTSTLVPAGWQVQRDCSGVLHLTRSAE